jgi:uncharacterized protein
MIMQKAIGSRVNLDDKSNKYAAEFRLYADALMDYKQVKRLDDFDQHFRTSRLQHSVNVAYYSYRIGKVLHCDTKKVIRAGMLHDLYWYDWHTDKTPQLHAFFHPRLALRNADNMLDDLSEREKDAILKHMWPLYWGIPKYRESVAVTLADKYAATLEVCYQWSTFFASSLVSKIKKQKT